MASSDGEDRTGVKLEQPCLDEERKRYNTSLHVEISADLREEAERDGISEVEVLCKAVILADTIAAEIQQGREVGYTKRSQYKGILYLLFRPLIQN